MEKHSETFLTMLKPKAKERYIRHDIATRHSYSKMYFDSISVEGLKSKFLYFHNRHDPRVHRHNKGHKVQNVHCDA